MRGTTCVNMIATVYTTITWLLFTPCCEIYLPPILDSTWWGISVETLYEKVFIEFLVTVDN